MAVIVLSLSLMACSALMQSPKTESITVPGTPREVYPRALQAFVRLGGLPTVAQSEAGVISGTVHHAVTMHITLVAVPDGTRIEVFGRLLPDKLMVGSFTEVEDYIALLR